jgi:hypothetical protein
MGHVPVSAEAFWTVIDARIRQSETLPNPSPTPQFPMELPLASEPGPTMGSATRWITLTQRSLRTNGFGVLSFDDFEF